MEFNPSIINEFLTQVGRLDEIPGPTEELFTTGLMDSFLMVELILHLETELGIQVPPEAINLDNFNTIATITSYFESINP